MYALIDCDNFYASCERLFQPKWRKRPLVVLSNNDGCIIARSAEAKALGVPMGVAVFEYKHMLHQYDMVVCSSNYALYGDLSRRVEAVLRRLHSQVEVYSVDEVFVDFGEMKLAEVIKRLHSAIREVSHGVGVPISVGLAATKTLAKLASRISKGEKPLSEKLTIIDSQNREQALTATEIADVWGIGRKLAPKLKQLGINNAWQLANVNHFNFRRKFNVNMQRTILELQGQSCYRYNSAPTSRKSMASTRSFGRPVTDLARLSEAIATYAARVAEKLRRFRLLAADISVFITTGKHEQQYRLSRSLASKFSLPTSDTGELQRSGIRLLEQLFVPGYRYAKAGVIISELVPWENFQFSLATQADVDYYKDQQARLKAIDAINAKYGRGTIRTGRQGFREDWLMRQESKSPNYTTSWQELKRIPSFVD